MMRTMCKGGAETEKSDLEQIRITCRPRGGVCGAVFFWLRRTHWEVERRRIVCSYCGNVMDIDL